MTDSEKVFIAQQFVKTYLPKKHVAIHALANDVTNWDIEGNYEYHGCGIPIVFSQPLKSMLANYNLPDSFLIKQSNNYIRFWDRKKAPFKTVRFYKMQLFPWKILMPFPGWFYPKYIYSIGNPIYIASNTIGIKYDIIKRNGQFVRGPVLAIFKTENGNLTLLSELK